MFPLAPTPILAAGVAPELGVVSVLAAIALLGVAAWFVVVSRDVATSFRRFQKLDRPASAPPRSNRSRSTSPTSDEPTPRATRPPDRIEV